MCFVTSRDVEMRRAHASPRANFVSSRSRRACESRSAIRAKRRREYALTSASAVRLENNFVAKNRDSESATRLRQAIERFAACFTAPGTRDARAQNNTCCIGFFAIAAVAGVNAARSICNRRRVSLRVRKSSAAGARALRRQHFLKWEDVFFVVLVYSG
jgi:hypothetical protein